MKRELLKQELAKELMSLQIGGQVPTIRQYADLLKSSVGTIQSILAEFEECGAVHIERRGWMGTLLQDRNISQLWSTARNGSPLVIAFPLPSTRICEGLATGVKELLSRSNIEAFLIFLRGSRNRLQALRQSRCHAIVVSGFTADEMCGTNESHVLNLPEKTYVQEHRVFYAGGMNGSQKQPLRVAVDPSSTDIQRLTELEFEGQNVEFIPTTYMLYAQMLNHHEVDAAIWEVVETVGRLGTDVPSRTLSERVLKKISNRNTQARFVTSKDDKITEIVLRECLDITELLKIQQSVVHGDRVPEY
jgi:hypothetical protein